RGDRIAVRLPRREAAFHLDDGITLREQLERGFGRHVAGLVVAVEDVRLLLREPRGGRLVPFALGQVHRAGDVRLAEVAREADVAVCVRVVERGSFTLAADDLELSRAVVSKYVSRLEERLGARLLHRTTRRLSLTEAGAALFEASRGALERIEEAEDAIAHLQSEPRGRLRVSAPMSFGILHLGPLLADVARA